MSFGFHAHPLFEIIGAVDAQIGKPSAGKGALGCNLTYQRNMGITPVDVDLGSLVPSDLRKAFAPTLGKRGPSILIACAPCTGFSRTLAENHLRDDRRNSLVVKAASFAAEVKPDIFLMENARELIQGKFSYHYKELRRILEKAGYSVDGSVHMLTRFGLPQVRERALVIAVRKGLTLRTLEDLWHGYEVRPEGCTVRAAIEHLPPIEAGEKCASDAMHTAPSFGSDNSLRRLQLTPRDGGSWSDLLRDPKAMELMTPAMKRSAERGDFGSHPDVYGRLWWDRPAVTIKRECSHIGNGRYSHPEQHRLCSVREMALLQGFPETYQFTGTLSNMYRHVGDAVPPLISYQLARLCEWILTDRKPCVEELVLPGTSLKLENIKAAQFQQLAFAI